MITAIWVPLAALVVLFSLSAWRGEGFAHRVAQGVWARIWSLTSYHRSGKRHDSLTEIVSGAGVPFLERVVRRFIPVLSGWFSSFPTDKGGFHDFLRLYDSLLAPYRDRRDLRLLEVGVNKGGSLALWREYFSADAHIYGMDVNPWVQTFPGDAGIKVVILDSRDAAAVSAAVGELAFDVIIDDGLHDPEAQRQTFRALRPFLKPDGVYIIEDVYAFDARDFRAHEDAVRVFPDRSGQRLVVLRPPACGAGEPPCALTDESTQMNT